MENNCLKKIVEALVTEDHKQRMMIEESFRDLKSNQYGFGMENNKVQKRKRLIVWFLIAALASLLVWVVGWLVGWL